MEPPGNGADFVGDDGAGIGAAGGVYVWSCPVCTFFNWNAHASVCNMCRAPKPPLGPPGFPPDLAVDEQKDMLRTKCRRVG